MIYAIQSLADSDDASGFSGLFSGTPWIDLVGMGVVPFEFTGGDTRKTLGLKGDEKVTIEGLDSVRPLAEVPATITYADGATKEITLKCRIDTAIEIEYIEHGGVLHYVLRDLANKSVAAE